MLAPKLQRGGRAGPKILKVAMVVIVTTTFMGLTLTSNATFAIGLIELRGKILGFDETQYKLQVGSDIYVVRSAGLSPEDFKDLKKKHATDEVHLMVPTTAIISVKNLPLTPEQIKNLKPIKK